MNLKRLKKIHTEHIFINPHNCKACWECIKKCNKKVIGKINILGLHKHIKLVKQDECVGCMQCLKECKYNAIMKFEGLENIFSRKMNSIK